MVVYEHVDVGGHVHYTLMVSSGSWILEDSFSLMYMSAYWLWENSDSGGRGGYLTTCGQSKLDTGMHGLLRISEVTLLKCSALLRGEGGAVSLLDTFGFLLITEPSVKHLPLIDYFFLDERVEMCTTHDIRTFCLETKTRLIRWDYLEKWFIRLFFVS